METSGGVGEDLRVLAKFCEKVHAACAWGTWMNQVCGCSGPPSVALETEPIERVKGERTSDLLYPRDVYRASKGKDRNLRLIKEVISEN